MAGNRLGHRILASVDCACRNLGIRLGAPNFYYRRLDACRGGYSCGLRSRSQCVCEPEEIIFPLLSGPVQADNSRPLVAGFFMRGRMSVMANEKTAWRFRKPTWVVVTVLVGIVVLGLIVWTAR
jgi:hypothetical protein